MYSQTSMGSSATSRASYSTSESSGSYYLPTANSHPFGTEPLYYFTSPGTSYLPPVPATGDSNHSFLPAAQHDARSVVPALPPGLPTHALRNEAATPIPDRSSSSPRQSSPARFPCPISNCNATFTRRFNLRGHMRTHAEQRPYVCAWAGCGKSFARALDCKRHETMHCSKAPSLICMGCAKPFSRSDSLRRHWRNGSGTQCYEKGKAIMAAEDAAEMLQSPLSGQQSQWNFGHGNAYRAQ